MTYTCLSCLSIYYHSWTSIYLIIYLCIHPSIHLSIFLYRFIFTLSFYPPIHPSIHPYIYPPIHPSIHTSTQPLAHPSIHPATHPSIQPSIHRLFTILYSDYTVIHNIIYILCKCMIVIDYVCVGSLLKSAYSTVGPGSDFRSWSFWELSSRKLT